MIPTENMKDFLLEHYRQISEHLRESDRKRDVLLGSYLVLVGGGLGFVFSTAASQTLALGIQVGFLILGILVAIFTGFARAWHCEYNRVTMAIHKAFLEEDFDLSKAAKQLKEASKFGSYFNPRGTEFVIMMFVLVLLSIQAVLLIIVQGYAHLSSLWSKVLLTIAAAIMPLLIGILWYKTYLRKRENESPQKSWCILEKEKQE